MLTGAAGRPGPIGVRLSSIGLDAAAPIGPAMVRTMGGSAVLWGWEPLPLVALVACVGRPVDALVAHPAFCGRGYVVERLLDTGSGSNGWGLEISTDVVPWTVPWARTSAVRR